MRVDDTGPATSRSRPAAVRQEGMRRHNLALALRHVLDAPHPLSRAEIAQATGLTRATVSALVDQLVAARLVAELEPRTGRRAGRPAVPLAPARGTVAAIGTEVNVDYLGARAVDLAGEVLEERVEHVDLRSSAPADVLPRLAGLAGGIAGRLAAAGVTVVGTAAALPGLVDRVTGPLRLAPNLGWRDVDVVALLADDPVLGSLPPRLANEANLAARAEAHARRHTGPSDFVYVSGEVGVGGAIVLEGRIFPGRHGWSGEIGHTLLGVDDAAAGGSTLESYAGQDAVLRAAGLPLDAPVDALLAALADGDVRARDAVVRAGRALGAALANVVHTVDVGHVVLGGVYAALAEHLRAPVTEELGRRVIWSPWAPVEVDVARAGPYPAMTGGALAVLGAFAEDPAAWAGDDGGAADPRAEVG